MDLTKLKEQDDRIMALFEDWPQSMRLRAYQFLYGRGIRIANIDHEILKAFRKEQENQ